MEATLTIEQKEVLEAILSGKNVFITGPGGTGKSFLIKHIREECAKLGKSVAVTALTGCAALLLGNGAKTLHGWSGIGLAKETADILIKNICKPRFGKARMGPLSRWKFTDILIIDEISMMTPDLLEKLDCIARHIRDNQEPFGGLQVVFCGDFCQLPPVVKGISGEELDTPRFVFESIIWDKIIHKTVLLKQIHRQQDETLQRVLNEARMGSLTPESIAVLETRKYSKQELGDIKPTLIFSRNSDVDTINEKNLAALDQEITAFKVETVIDPKNGNRPVNIDDPEVQRAINRLDNDAPYVPILTLCVGAQVMLISNLDVDAGLVNGSRGVITAFTATNMPVVKFMNGSKVTITRETWMTEDYPIGRMQIPLRLAYAITIHKSQGATLDCALIDIGKSTFEFGQAYVALSRVKSLEGLYIWDLVPSRVKAHSRVVEYYKKLEN